MSKTHHYKTTIIWNGDLGTGTSRYDEYDRSHSLLVHGKTTLAMSSDTAFRGDASKHNPEDMLLYSLSSCHMLWYLHLCADANIIVTDYQDNATAIMQQTDDGGGYFSEATLHPIVTITDATAINLAKQLHKEAHKKCFIANSVNFVVNCEPEINTIP
jgi:organic hydroperoxide reductase OsmC/OhrA